MRGTPLSFSTSWKLSALGFMQRFDFSGARTRSRFVLGIGREQKRGSGAANECKTQFVKQNDRC